MERDCESELSKLNIEQNACIYHFGASVIHGQRSNILRLRTCTRQWTSYSDHVSKCRTCAGNWTFSCSYCHHLETDRLSASIVCKKTAYGSGHYGIPADHNTGRYLFHFDLFQYCDKNLPVIKMEDRLKRFLLFFMLL